MRIHIENLSFKTIIGILETERITPQRVILNVHIDYDYQPSFFINYADVCLFLEQEMTAMRYALLEEAIEDLGGKLSQKYTQMTFLSLKILKPDILPNATVGLSKEFNYNKN